MNLHQSERVQAFIAEIIEVSKRHDLSIAHEDFHGGFIIQHFCERNVEWLKDATDESDRIF